MCGGFLGGGGQKAPPPHPWAVPKKSILNRVNTSAAPTCTWSETLATWNKFEGSTANIEIVQSEELAETLQKPFIRRFEKQKVYASF